MLFCRLYLNRGSSVSIVPRLQVGLQDNSVSTVEPRNILDTDSGETQRHLEWTQGVRRPGRDADPLTPPASSSEG
jgi:hypothetical protein